MDAQSSTAKSAAIRLLGDPSLRKVAGRIESFEEPEFALDCRRLCATLLDFRNRTDLAGPS